jgi:hypothetical protein
MAIRPSILRACFAIVTGALVPLLPVACGLGAGGTAPSSDEDAGAPGPVPSTSPAMTCTPGAHVACSCASGTDGVKACDDAGAGFGACTGCVAEHDASQSMESKEAGGSPADGATDADAGGCGNCIQATCPTQMAACGAASDCQVYLACDLLCSSSQDDGGCSDACGAAHPAGEQDFAALTLCSLACGAGCL